MKFHLYAVEFEDCTPGKVDETITCRCAIRQWWDHSIQMRQEIAVQATVYHYGACSSRLSKPGYWEVEGFDVSNLLATGGLEKG